MDETKIYNKLLEHDGRFKEHDDHFARVDSKLDRLTQKVVELTEDMAEVKERLEQVPTRTEMNEKLDKIIHIVERLDQERTVTSYRLDDHDARIGKLEQSVGTV